MRTRTRTRPAVRCESPYSRCPWIKCAPSCFVPGLLVFEVPSLTLWHLSFVCAVSSLDVTHPTGPTLFRTYDVLKKSHNCEIWEAARATSAAPTFFSAIEIGPLVSKIRYVDAGLGYNNPVKQVVAEAATHFGSDALVTCVVSIGTGQPKISSYDKPGLIQNAVPTRLADILKDIATDCETTGEDMHKRCRDNPGIYYRLNVNRGLDDIELDEWKRLPDVTEHTTKYLQREEVKQQVENIVEALCGESHYQSCSAGLLGRWFTLYLCVKNPNAYIVQMELSHHQRLT